MARWEPERRGRLEQAALELYGERGFEQTTVAEIAERAGLTERTFFRHFADKREVLFAGSGALQRAARAHRRRGAARPRRRSTRSPRRSRPPAPVLEERRELARQRQAIIAANAELRERELIKLASLAAALADALRERGVARARREPDRRGGHRRLQGRVRALGRRGRRAQTCAQIVRESLAELKTVTAGGYATLRRTT